MDLAGAFAYLDDHVNLETDASARAAAKRLDRVGLLVELLGEPQRAYPVVHITGTNGKGSTARMLTALLVAKGLSVGTYTSPHVEHINERIAWNGESISDAAFVEIIEAVASVEQVMDAPPTHFEILTAAAFRWFADIAVDVGVIEVGLGGRWDATNIVDGQVAVVTNVELDHAEVIESRQLETRNPVLTMQRRQGFEERMGTGELTVAIGAKHQHAHRLLGRDHLDRRNPGQVNDVPRNRVLQ